MEYSCFVPGCTNILSPKRHPKSPSYYTFHWLPKDVELLVQLLDALDLPETTVTGSDSVMCSAHFHPIIEHYNLVRTLLEESILEKPSVMAVSSAPRCAASVAGCSMNLYSGIALFKFPEAGRRFDLWRMVAGSPPIQDCMYLCARHFKRNSFVDLNMEELIEGSIPVYPTRPPHPVHMNYRPLKKPVLLFDSSSVSNVVDPYQINDCVHAKSKIEAKKKWRCAAVGCDVSNESHPDMRKINMPPYNDRLSLWREIVGDKPSTKYNNSLCTRHFGINQFYDGETRKHFVKMTNPVYPTGPLNMNTMDYCPPELDITVAMETDGDEDLVVVTIDNHGESKIDKEVEEVPDADGDLSDVTIARCSSVGCPVASKTHPNVQIYNFPYKTLKRINSWLRIAGETCIQPLRLCARHFDIYKRELTPKYPFWDLDPETQTYKPIFDPANPRCCVPGCTPPDEHELSYHRFPLDKQAFKVWVQRIGWKQLELYDKGDVFRGFRVCSQHFSKRWFMTNEYNEQVLRPGAIPTLFPTNDSFEQKPNEDDMSYEIAVMDPQNLEEESYFVSIVADSDEINLSPVNAKKRRSSLQTTDSPDPKKLKVPPSTNLEVMSDAEQPSGGQTSSSITEISFWIASPSPSDVLGESVATCEDGKPDMLDPTSEKETEVSLLDHDDSGGGDITVASNAGDGSSVKKKNHMTTIPDKPSTEIGSDCEHEANPVEFLEEQDSCSIIEESETCKLWTEPSRSQKKRRVVNERGNDLLDSASRLCNFSISKMEKLRSLAGKEKEPLCELEELLVEHLEHVITITGVDFLKKCFEYVVNSSSKKVRKLPKDDERSKDAKKFAVSFQSLSAKGYHVFSQTANLPPSCIAREWATNENGYPGFNKQAFTRLSSKMKELGESGFFISLCITEVTIDKHIEWNGSDLFGYVDLGCGRIKDDYISEASSVLMFHANGVTHDFSLPLGYCLIRDLSPKIRANLIHQYLLQIHSVGVKCNALVCDGSAITYRTYVELGVISTEITPRCGFFKHPANKIDNVYCFIDIHDAMMLNKNDLAESEFFLTKYKQKVRWSDVEQIHDFLQWNFKSNMLSSTSIKGSDGNTDELEKLQVQLKNDSRPFKRNGAKALKCLYERYCRSLVKAEGSIEFLSQMESITDLFSGRHMFSKEKPVIRRSNTTVTLGSIKNHLIYLNSLTDLNDVKLYEGARRIPMLYLHLNLVSLEGYLRRTFMYERKKSAKMVMTQSFTLSKARETIQQLVPTTGSLLITASQFRDAYFNKFCRNQNPEPLSKYTLQSSLRKQETTSISPLHIGLCVSESYKYEHLSMAYEGFSDFLTDNVLHSWLDSEGCPDCRSLVLDEINHFEEGLTSLISDVNKMFKVAENYLCICDEIPLNADGFYRFTNSVLNGMVCFDGFKLHEHLFNSVEFGKTSHFTTLVKDLLGVYLRYRISFMPTQGRVLIKPGVRTTFNRRSRT